MSSETRQKQKERKGKQIGTDAVNTRFLLSLVTEQECGCPVVSENCQH